MRFSALNTTKIYFSKMLVRMCLSSLILKKQSSYNFTLGTDIPLGHTRLVGSDTLCASGRILDRKACT